MLFKFFLLSFTCLVYYLKFILLNSKWRYLFFSILPSFLKLIGVFITNKIIFIKEYKNSNWNKKNMRKSEYTKLNYLKIENL